MRLITVLDHRGGTTEELRITSATHHTLGSLFVKIRVEIDIIDKGLRCPSPRIRNCRGGRDVSLGMMLSCYIITTMAPWFLFRIN